MTLAVVAFLGMFAVITPALISGAVADRMKFSAWAIFVPVWSLLVYVPVFKWVYGGWLGQRGSLDFAGGTAIHVNAGIAALACVLVLGKRKGWPQRGSPAALDAAGHDRHRHPVVRLVRLQRRLGPRRQRPGRPGVHEHLPRRGRRRPRLGASSRSSATGTSPTSALPRASWPAWWRSPRGAGYVSGMSPIFIGLIAGVVCCFAVQPEDQGRLRRRARRGGRALRRRPRRLAADRPLRRTPTSSVAVGHEPASSTAAARAAARAGCSPTVPRSSTRSRSPSCSCSCSRRPSASGVARSTEATGLDLALHGETAYHSGGLG
jgi:hypothetical protein